MSTSWHSVEITAGASSWTMVPNQPPAFGQLVGTLRVGWELTDHPVFGQPQPWQATFQVAVERLVDVTLNIGDPVSIHAWQEAPGTDMGHGHAAGVPRPPLVQFLGRVASITADPARFPHAAGTTAQLVTVSCVDYTVDLSEPTVGGAGWPSELVHLRTDRILDEAGVPHLGDILAFTAALTARDAGPGISARAALVEALDSVASWFYVNVFADGVDPETALAAGSQATAPEPTRPYSMASAENRIIYEADPGGAGARPGVFVLPGVFAPGPDGWHVVIDPRPDPLLPRAGQVLDACDVELGVTWSKQKATAVDQVTLTGTHAVTVRHPDAVPIEWSGDTQLVELGDVMILADYLLPEPAKPGWTVDKVTVLDLEPDQLIGWLAVYMASYFGYYHLPVVIDGIDPAVNPEPTSYYAGQLQGVEFTLSDSAWQFELQLRRNLPRAASFGTASSIGYLNAADMLADPTLAALTVADLDPTLTAYDLRLARRP